MAAYLALASHTFITQGKRVLALAIHIVKKEGKTVLASVDNVNLFQICISC